MLSAAPHAQPRPHNLRRSVTHILSGLVALAVIQVVPDRSWLIAIAGAMAMAAWTMETSRRASPRVNAVLMKLFGPIAHKHEWTQVNSATWYSTALLFLALFCSPLACSVAVMVLAVSDPVAAFVGRRWGTVRLRSGRSLEGFLGFAGSAAVVGLATISVFYPQLSATDALLLVGAGAIVGAFTELYSNRFDDNFAIPVAVALTVSIAAASMGVQLAV